MEKLISIKTDRGNYSDGLDDAIMITIDRIIVTGIQQLEII